ncbi:MAG: ArsR/SmtB family transcription factor [Capsulimonadaceae bacterium]
MPDKEPLRKFKAAIFQALAHPTRIAIVEMLRDGEVAVARIYEELRIEPANASQHLAVLRSKHVVVSRKEANQVFYRIRDRSIIDVLDIMRRYFEMHVSEVLAELNEISSQTFSEPEMPDRDR